MRKQGKSLNVATREIGISQNAFKIALVYDFQELFRWLVDLSIVELLAQKKLKSLTSLLLKTATFACVRLTEQTGKMQVERISLDFNRKACNFKHGKNFTCQNILLDNIQQLSNFIWIKEEKYHLGYLISRLQEEEACTEKETQTLSEDAIKMEMTKGQMARKNDIVTYSPL